MNTLLEISDVSKAYGRKKALNHVTLTVGRGRIIGLLGPNGSGKSTLIKLINGLLTLDEGKILINGYEPGVETKKVVSYLPERTYLDNNMTVEDIIEYFQKFYEDFSTERAYSMLESLDIQKKDKLKELSKGTREKVGLILVMSRKAQLYVLDEPIAGVDPAARDYILRTIIQNYDEDVTIILSTHLISDIENILDEVIFMKEGEILFESTVEELREKQGKSLDAYFREVFAC